MEEFLNELKNLLEKHEVTRFSAVKVFSNQLIVHTEVNFKTDDEGRTLVKRNIQPLQWKCAADAECRPQEEKAVVLDSGATGGWSD